MTPQDRRRLQRSLTSQLFAAVAAPFILLALTGSPIPSHLPTSDQVALWWNTVHYTPTAALPAAFRVLIDLAWITWAWHAAWTLAAFVWIVLRLPTVTLPKILLRLTPAFAAQIIVLGTAAAASAHPTTALHTRTPMPHEQPRVAAPTSTVVQPGDTLWGLSKAQYGDGRDWQTLYDANRDRPEPDGDILTNPDLIHPGWTLVLPTTTPSTSPAAPATGAAHHNASLPRLVPAPPSPANPAASDTGPPATTTTTTEYHTTTADSPPVRLADIPHTVGWTTPDGGYLTITTLTAIATACTLIRRRNRTSTTPVGLPHLVTALAAAADQAKAAATYGYLPDEQDTRHAPPPLYLPQPATTALAVGPRPDHETAFAPTEMRILSLTGPGARNAAAALALSILSAAPPPTLVDHLTAGKHTDPPRLVIDQDLASHLFALTKDVDGISDDPAWLTVCSNASAAALAAFSHPGTAAARGEMTTRATVLLTRGPLDQLGKAVRASHADGDTPVSVVHLDDKNSDGAKPITAHPGGPTTRIDVALDGSIIAARGPVAERLTGARLQILGPDLAREVYQVIRHARTPKPRNHHAIPHQAASEDDTEADRIPRRHPTASTAGNETESTTSHQLEPDPPHRRDAPLTLRLLGRLEIHGPAGTVPVTGDKTAALLTLLALHPRGRTIAQIADQAWNGLHVAGSDAAPVRSAIARARTLLRQTHGPLDTPPGTQLLTGDSGNFRLNPAWITTDISHLDRIADTLEHTRDPVHRAELVQAATRLDCGELAEGLDDWDRDWLSTARAAHTQRLEHITTGSSLDPRTQPQTIP